MAKKHAEAGHDLPATHQSITIQKTAFTVPAPYAEGQTINALEAQALNTVFGENLRNNFAAKVKAARGADENAILSPEQITELQAALDAYAAEYKFSVRTAAAPRLDPVTKTANALAREAIKARLKAKSIDVKELPEGRLDQLVLELVAKEPFYTEEATRRLSAANHAASGVLESLGL